MATSYETAILMALKQSRTFNNKMYWKELSGALVNSMFPTPIPWDQKTDPMRLNIVIQLVILSHIHESSLALLFVQLLEHGRGEGSRYIHAHLLRRELRVALTDRIKTCQIVLMTVGRWYLELEKDDPEEPRIKRTFETWMKKPGTKGLGEDVREMARNVMRAMERLPGGATRSTLHAPQSFGSPERPTTSELMSSPRRLDSSRRSDIPNLTGLSTVLNSSQSASRAPQIPHTPHPSRTLRRKETPHVRLPSLNTPQSPRHQTPRDQTPRHQSPRHPQSPRNPQSPQTFSQSEPARPGLTRPSDSESLTSQMTNLTFSSPP
ncbi:hypothetical protein PSACC_01858 [Paramicrosporidium saccamoebae]|uniref:Uncharacterized protein n=1 Tax=Paramicrosporidium saccamoebae TaxID=1246581 RepID=A0A2H9TKM5_9FUNG|nr:hypothetical protein PSACC_01858 [Paramicrosporidium saccamoebae]